VDPTFPIEGRGLSAACLSAGQAGLLLPFKIFLPSPPHLQNTSLNAYPSPSQEKPSMTDETNTKVKGDYQILGVLGAGGMGKVYKVRNVLSDRVEAMKILLPDLSDQKDLADRFLLEIKVLAALHHPNIAELRTALTIDNQLVMIMEFVDGVSLAKRLEQGPIPVPEAVASVDQVLAALGYAHAQKVIHRDIKPANMMVTPSGTVKLMDFGIARSGTQSGLTMTGTTLGSVSYMSPEQVKCEPIDGRSDLYSVGVSLYEMVSGQKPFQDENNFAVMKAHIEQQPRPPIELKPDIPPALSQLILMAMAKDPAQRFQSADAFRGALRSVAPELGPVTAIPKPSSAAAAAACAAAAATVVATPAPIPARTIPLTPTPEPHAYPRTQPSTPIPSEYARGHGAPPTPAKGHRGLYITIGALVVVVVLVLAGLGLPRWMKAHAGSGSSSHAVNSPPAPNPSPSPAPKPEAPSPKAVATAPGVTPTPNPPSPTTGKTNVKVAGTAEITAGNAPGKAPGTAQVPPPNSPLPQTPAVDPALMEALTHQLDMLSARSAAVDSSLDTLKQEQNTQGYSLRGDMAMAQQLMHTYLLRAQSAVQDGDAANAQKYLDLADAQTSKLEKFLGR
jgi:eukaryotic-like serine/threonine-protein kinase